MHTITQQEFSNFILFKRKPEDVDSFFNNNVFEINDIIKDITIIKTIYDEYGADIVNKIQFTGTPDSAKFSNIIFMLMNSENVFSKLLRSKLVEYSKSLTQPSAMDNRIQDITNASRSTHDIIKSLSPEDKHRFLLMSPSDKTQFLQTHRGINTNIDNLISNTSIQPSPDQITLKGPIPTFGEIDRIVDSSSTFLRNIKDGLVHIGHNLPDSMRLFSAILFSSTLLVIGLMVLIENLKNKFKIKYGMTPDIGFMIIPLLYNFWEDKEIRIKYSDNHNEFIKNQYFIY